MIKDYSTVHPLVISLDTNLLKEEYGNAQMRQLEYSKHLGSYTIIVLNTAKTKKDYLPVLKKDNLFIYPTNSNSRFSYVADTLKLVSNLRKTHTWNLITTQDLYVTGLIGVLLKRRFQLPLNLQIHNNDLLSSHWQKHSLQNQIFNQLAQWNLRQADTIRYLNLHQFDYLKSKFPGKISSSYKAPIYVDTHYFHHPVNPKSHIINLITVGRLTWEKNYTNLIQAIRQVSNKHPKIHLNIIGDGPELSTLNTLITQLKLNNNVTLAGWASIDSVKKHLLNADAFILTSYDEGWGMVIIEAVAAGLPIIMPNTGCAVELIINDETGLVYDGQDPTAISIAINHALVQPEKMFEMAGLAQLNLQSTYTKDKLLTAWLDCLYATKTFKT